jgi:hypothetical protein
LKEINHSKEPSMLFLIELDHITSGTPLAPETGRAFIEHIIFLTLARTEEFLKVKKILAGGRDHYKVGEHGDAGDNQRTSGEWSASFTHRSNPEEPRYAGATRHGGRGDAQRGIIPRFSMLS